MTGDHGDGTAVELAQADVARALELLVEHDDGVSVDVVGPACARMAPGDAAFVRRLVADPSGAVGARLVALVLLARD